MTCVVTLLADRRSIRGAPVAPSRDQCIRDRVSLRLAGWSPSIISEACQRAVDAFAACATMDSAIALGVRWATHIVHPMYRVLA